MLKSWRVFVASGIAIALGGCSTPISYLSYQSATTPNYEHQYVMDPGSFGGDSQASGGLHPGLSYGTGAAPGNGSKMYAEEVQKYSNVRKPNWSGDGFEPYKPQEGR